MSYSWLREEWEHELDGGETIIDWSSIAEPSFTLVALLTSKGAVRIYCNTRNDGVKHYITHVQKFAPSTAEASAICILPDASGLAFILVKGSVLLVPLRSIMDVPWGRCDILLNDSISVLEVNGVEEGCLCMPTSALCYNTLHSKRPFLIYSNKAGQLFIIDLTVMTVSVMLRAPESIHDIELYTTKDSVHLLVNGFTGEQWILPLETDGCGLRETLGQVIPWDIKEQRYRPSRVTVAHDEMLAVLDTENSIIKFFDDIKMKAAKTVVNVPKNTWLINSPTHAIFAVTDQDSGSGVSIYFGGLFGIVDVLYEKICDLLDEKILGFVSVLCEDGLPSCLIITELGVITVSPKKSFREALVDCIAKHGYCHDVCKVIAEKFSINQLELVQDVLDYTLPNIKHSYCREIVMDKLIYLGLDSSVPLVTLIQWFAKHNCEGALVEVVNDVCAKDPNEQCRYFMVNLCVARYRAQPDQRDKIEAVLNEFLAQHPDIDDGLEQLLEAGFWTSIAIIADSTPSNAQIVGEYLANTEKEWPAAYCSCIVKILSNLRWRMLCQEDAETLLRRMADFLIHLTSVPHLSAFSKIASEQMRSYWHPAAVLYALSSIRLLQMTLSGRPPSATDAVISSGSSCTAVITSEETLGFWGEFSPGKHKAAKNREKSCAIRACRLHNFNVPCRVASVSCGTEHLLCLTVSGIVYSFGRNRFGQCGVGHTDEVTNITEVVGSYGRACVISAGNYHSALINEQGLVFTWGWSLHGQLGIDNHSSLEDLCVPHIVSCLKGRVISVACGYAHTLFLMDSGVVYSCGNGSYGQLGAGVEIRKRSQPDVVLIPDKVKLIASKYFHCLAVTENQKIYCWGINPQALKMKMFVKRKWRTGIRNDELTISQDHLAVSELDHTVDGEIIHIDAGYNHSALINEYKNLFTWGKGLDMQLGHGSKNEQEQPLQLFQPTMCWNYVSCGYDFTTAITPEGVVYVWGRNDKGHLGVEPRTSPPEARKIVYKTKKGSSKTIEVAVGNPCLPFPTKFRSVMAYTLSEMYFDERRKYSFIDFLKKLDSKTISTISSHLLRNPVYCLPAVYMHLLAGDLIHATEFLVHISSEDMKVMVDNNNVSEDTAFSSLMDIVWNMLCKHPDFTVKSKIMADLLNNFTVSDRVTKSKKLNALAALYLISKPEMFHSLNSLETVEILENWQPDCALPGIEISQDLVQNYVGRVRYWTCCGFVEKCSSTTQNNDKRRICSKCREKWSDLVRAKLLKYENDPSK